MQCFFLLVPRATLRNCLKTSSERTLWRHSCVRHQIVSASGHGVVMLTTLRLGSEHEGRPRIRYHLAHSKSYSLQCPWQPTDVQRPALQGVKMKRSTSASYSSTALSSQVHQPKRLSLRPHPAPAWSPWHRKHQRQPQR